MPTYEIYKGEQLERTVTVSSSFIDMQLEEGEHWVKIAEDAPAQKRGVSDLINEFANELTEVGAATRPLLNTKEAAKHAIDQAAGRARVRRTSQGALISDEYNQAKLQVALWRQLGSPSNDVPVMISSRAHSLGVTDEEAASSIEQAAQQYEELFNATFSIRLAGKKAVDDADEETYQQVAQGYINQLDLL